MQAKGEVWYLTYTLTFGDKARWQKQEIFTGPPSRWVNRRLHGLSAINKTQLIKNKRVAYKDHNGVWIEIQILDHEVPNTWGKHA
jgi:hypothetical protein